MDEKLKMYRLCSILWISFGVIGKGLVLLLLNSHLDKKLLCGQKIAPMLVQDAAIFHFLPVQLETLLPTTWYSKFFTKSLRLDKPNNVWCIYGTSALQAGVEVSVNTDDKTFHQVVWCWVTKVFYKLISFLKAFLWVRWDKCKHIAIWAEKA